MVHSVPERNSPVLYLAKYNITKLVRPIDKFPFLISLLASIIKIIILSFCFHFLISHTNYYLNIILVQNVSPLALWYILFWEHTIIRYIYDVEGFLPGWFTETILHICPLHPFSLSNTVLPAQYYPFTTMKSILKLCQMIISLYLLPVLYHHLHGHYVLPLHLYQFLI